MGKLTDRGEIVNAGFATLAGPDGDDTLTRPDTARADEPDGTTGATDTGDQSETGTGDGDDTAEPSPSPAHDPATETAVNVTADDRETRA